MNIKRLIFYFLIVTASMCACTAMPNELETTNDIAIKDTDVAFSTTASITKEMFDVVDHFLGESIILFDKQAVYYETTDLLSENPERPYKTLYQFDLQNKKASQLSYFKCPTFSRDPYAAISDDKLYFTCDDDDNQHIMQEVDLRSHESVVIKKWSEDNICSNAYIMNGKPLLYSIDVLPDNLREYSIQLIDPDQSYDTKLISEKYDGQNGINIPQIDVDDTNIYAFKVSFLNNVITNFISIYDSAGNLVYEIPIDFQDFLFGSDELKELGGDGIWGIYKEGDYFIFPTLNGRVSIWRWNGENEMERVAIPKLLHTDTPRSTEGYNLLDYSGDNPNVYFSNPFKGEDSLIIFNTTSGQFKSVSLPYDENLYYVYYRNENGDLLVKEENRGTGETKYSLLRAEQLIKTE